MEFWFRLKQELETPQSQPANRLDRPNSREARGPGVSLADRARIGGRLELKTKYGMPTALMGNHMARHSGWHPAEVSAACQQRRPIEHHADRPDRRRAAEPRQYLFGQQRLDEEQAEGRDDHARSQQYQEYPTYAPLPRFMRPKEGTATRAVRRIAQDWVNAPSEQARAVLAGS
jgi:hypothetical protein